MVTGVILHTTLNPILRLDPWYRPLNSVLENLTLKMLQNGIYWQTTDLRLSVLNSLEAVKRLRSNKMETTYPIFILLCQNAHVNEHLKFKF